MIGKRMNRITSSERNRLCRIAGVVTLLAVIPMGAATASAKPRARANVAGPTPEALRGMRDHELRTLDGKRFTLAGLEGDVVVINFWASWCPPCRKELPALDALNAEIAGHGGRVLAVSIDLDPENAKAFACTHGLALPIAHDGPDGLARSLDLPHVPFTMVLDAAGAVAFTTSGADERALEQVRSITRRLVAKQASTPRASEGVANERQTP
jgi:thiol-disulfide isomerase/thioredoxin